VNLCTRTITAIAFVLGCLGGTSLAQDFDLFGAVEHAQAGAVIEIPAGYYKGHLEITVAMSLIGIGEVVLDGGGDGDVITIRASDVTIRGLTIRGTGTSLDRENAGITVLAPRTHIVENTLEDVLFGIYLKKANNSVIRGNIIGGKPLRVARRGDGIRLWESSGSIVEDNIIENSRDVVMWFSDDVQIRRNRISHGRYGLHFMYSDRNVLEENILSQNSVGAFLMYSHDLQLIRNSFDRNRGPTGYGVGLKDVDGVIARDNLFAGNRIGLFLDNSPSDVDRYHDFTGNTFAYNDIGIAFMPAVQRNRFYDNAFVENVEQVAIMGGGDFKGNEFTVDGRGNYWSDYNGYDMDNDGIGDLPYRAEELFENLMDQEPKLRLFLFSPAQQAIDMAARAFPAVRPRPKLTDTSPLSEPIALRAPTEASSRHGGPLLALAGVLLGASGAVVLVGARSQVGRPGRVGNQGASA